jgi:integrase/recombinase XerD
MSAASVITIFVRHAEECAHNGDEFYRRCRCRKHLRWSKNGTQFRRTAGTRSWAEAEKVRREIEDQLAGRTAEPELQRTVARDLQECLDIFLKDKKVQGVSVGVLGKYQLELGRLRDYCQRNRVYTVQGLTRELFTGYCGTWEKAYPSGYTRIKVRERCRAFLRYCYEAQWLPRIPSLPKMKGEAAPTMPLRSNEYARLLDALYVATPRRWDGKLSSQGLSVEMRPKLHGLIQLMRWSGLAIQDAVTLERAKIQLDDTKKIYRVVTSRQKTGTDVSVPIPGDVAKELLDLKNSNPRYLFWTGEGSGQTISKTWANRYIRPLFEAAEIPCDGHMVSHRLRDTFAVDLLEKGVPMEEVSKLLGHESIRTTERHYAKWVKGRQDRADALVMATWEVG